MKKLLSETYLRDVSNYDIKCFNEEDFYVTTKKIIEVESRFVTKRGLCLIDEGYFIVEVIPKNENYAMRVFLNRQLNPVEYYFDISRNNGFDNDAKSPFYEDLYTDIIVLEDSIRVVDENELKEAYKNGVISKEDFLMANKSTANLLKELHAGTNKYKNMNLLKYLNFK